MRYTVALTGGIGSGKSTVANAFADLGINIIDADIIARQVVEPGTPALKAIEEHFGSEVIAADGSLQRRILRERIFPILRKKLAECPAPSAYSAGNAAPVSASDLTLSVMGCPFAGGKFAV
jgi:dephospho-CoA kinase